MDPPSTTTNGETPTTSGESTKADQANQIFAEVNQMLSVALSSFKVRSGDGNMETRCAYPSLVLAARST